MYLIVGRAAGGHPACAAAGCSSARRPPLKKRMEDSADHWQQDQQKRLDAATNEKSTERQLQIAGRISAKQLAGSVAV